MRYTYANLVAMAADRMARLARPRDGESPPVGVAGPEVWAALAGVNAEPHALLGKAKRLDTDHDPAVVARAALQRLVVLEIVEDAGPDQWRPTAPATLRSPLGSVRGQAEAATGPR